MKLSCLNLHKKTLFPDSVKYILVTYMLTICFKSVVPELLFLQQTKENLKVINGGNQTKHNYPRQFTFFFFNEMLL